MRVAVVDETSSLGEAARRALSSVGAAAMLAGPLRELPLAFDARKAPDLLIINVTNGLTGRQVAARIERSGYRGRVLAFVDALDNAEIHYLTRLPDVECVARPRSTAQLDEVLTHALRATRRDAERALAPIPSAYHGIIGESSRMADIFARITKVAVGDVNVCIHGESGTGKELIARAIHYASPRRDRPLITLDCTTIPEGLMESHLFGHVKGAFTGATEHREGVFALAHTGTLFIDELGELSPTLQAKLLRVIQTREFSKVGGTRPIRTDIRLITATNKDLRAAVAQGTFREDLYYRVAVFMIKVPPLRERLEDIPRLVEHFLQRFASLYGKRVTRVAPATLKRMMTLPWPGNIRQLENFLEQAVVLAEGETLTDRDLFAGELSNGATPASPALPSGLFEAGLPLSEVERRHILRTLHKVHGNRTEAARLLQISVRCLQYKLKAYGRDVEASTAPDLAHPRENIG
ncbi:MAG TPA: sigma-54 dependent transcriptional regulator [Methylomirabilota bacterium]|nr:sigma-54 dependent transcriptional regulator [Methylomirabilota bacterium]